MNEIHWQQKRMMTSKQFPSSSAVNSRYLYDQTKNYQPIDNRLQSYSTVANRSYNNINLPYASSAYGVYRRLPPNLRAPPSVYTHLSRHIDLRNKPYHSQQRQLSDSGGNNNDYLKYEELNGSINAIYNDETDDDDDDDDYEKYCSNIFNYTFPITGVSFLFK